MSKAKATVIAVLVFTFIAIPLTFLSQNISSTTTVDPALKRSLPDISSRTTRRGFPIAFKENRSGFYGPGSTRFVVFNNEITNIIHEDPSSFSNSTKYDIGYFALDALIYLAVFMTVFIVIDKRRKQPRHQ